MHLNPPFLHLQRPEHTFLQPHLTSSWHDLAASATVIQTGDRPFHPKCSLSGSSCSTRRACRQQMLCRTARRICCNKASDVGGQFSIGLPFFVNSQRRASFTDIDDPVRSYRRTTKRSNSDKTPSSIIVELNESRAKTSVISGNAAQTTQAVFLPRPLKLETVSQPVKAYQNSNAKHFSLPKCLAYA